MQHQSYTTTLKYINMGRQMKDVVGKLHVPNLIPKGANA
jgi:hypothetical protein